MQVNDFEELTRTREIRSDRVAAIRKDFLGNLRHRDDYLKRFRRKVAPHVVPDLLSRIFHIPDQNTASFQVEVLPRDPRGGEKWTKIEENRYESAVIGPPWYNL